MQVKSQRATVFERGRGKTGVIKEPYAGYSTYYVVSFVVTWAVIEARKKVNLYYITLKLTCS